MGKDVHEWRRVNGKEDPNPCRKAFGSRLTAIRSEGAKKGGSAACTPVSRWKSFKAIAIAKKKMRWKYGS